MSTKDGYCKFLDIFSPIWDSHFLNLLDLTLFLIVRQVINVDLTRSYLDLITTYVSLMILVSRVEDRKAVIGLFNTAHELTHGHSESSFPRLGQMIVEYENPMKKLSEEFVPHAKLLFNALISLQGAFHMRNLAADEWRKSQILSIVANPNKILTPAQTEPINSEYMSVDTMERYIICKFLPLSNSLKMCESQNFNQLFDQFPFVEACFIISLNFSSSSLTFQMDSWWFISTLISLQLMSYFQKHCNVVG